MAEPSFSRLKVLQSDSQSLYYKLASLVLSFAVLGYTDVAMRLVSKLNKHDRLHGMHVVLRPLWLLWDTLGSWPDGEKDAVHKFIKRDREREAKSGNGEGDGEPAGKQAKVDVGVKDITEDDVKKRLDELATSYAQGWWWPSKGHGDKGPHAQELSASKKKETIKQILQGFDEMEPAAFKNAHTGAMAMDASSGLVSALDLALSLDSSETEESVPSAKEILNRISKRMSANQQLQYLAQSRGAWSILKDGALAKALNLDTSKVDDFAQQIKDVITERFTNGKLELDDLPIRRILELLDHHASHNPEALAEDAGFRRDSPSQSLFRDPATPAQIAQAEKDLEIQLPEDYKEFLSISNGFGAMFGGIIYEPPLHPVSEICWFSDDMDYFTDLELDLLPDCEVSTTLPNYSVTVGKAIEIGTEDIDNTWLIPPAKVSEFKQYIKKLLDGGAAAEGEAEEEIVDDDTKAKLRKAIKDFAGSEEKFWEMDWCCMTWASGGSALMTGYSSFKAYLRSLADQGDKRDGDLLRREEWWGYAFVKGKSEGQE